MEDWSEYSENNKIIIPAANGIRVFWDSGNHGSVKANTILTNKSDELKNTGNFSARLESKYANILGIGKFAAGNLFIGEYVKTDGTDGVLSFGREYNGSHPKALRVYANYRPQPVKSNASKNNYLTTGQSDQGQIYIALSTSPIEIRTKSSNQKLFNENDKEILAYGQVTFTQDFGDDNVLEKIDIPLTYNERGKTTEAKYLIIVCSASKYGDFFCGGEGSIMYLDDFELIYE